MTSYFCLCITYSICIMSCNVNSLPEPGLNLGSIPRWVKLGKLEINWRKLEKNWRKKLENVGKLENKLEKT